MRNNEEIGVQYSDCFEPVTQTITELLSEKVADEVIEELSDCMSKALYVAGVSGMELAIGVMNGTIKQTIE